VLCSLKRTFGRRIEVIIWKKIKAPELIKGELIS
jgi:hypothetical protein